MTFSDPSVAKALNRSFACAWLNMTPNVKYRDGMYAQARVPQGLSVGTGVTNVTAIFAAADGTVIHAMPGYLDVGSFLRHLEFAKSLHAKLSDPKVRREDRAGLYSAAHLEAAKTTWVDLEQEAHRLLAPRFMRVDEWPRRFFYGLNRGG